MFSVCYVSKTEVCLLCDADSLPNGYNFVKGSTLRNYSWTYQLTLPNYRSYTGSCANLTTDIFSKSSIMPIAPKQSVTTGTVSAPLVFALDKNAANLNTNTHIMIRWGENINTDVYSPAGRWVQNYSATGMDGYSQYGTLVWPAIDIIL